MKRVQHLLSRVLKFAPKSAAMNVLGGFAMCLAIAVAVYGAESRPAWQINWERTVKAAEAEGQLTVYISGYSAVIEAGVFQRAFPKIKVTIVPGTGTQLAPRIVAERRAEKFLADVYNGGGTSLYQVLYLARCSNRFGRRLCFLRSRIHRSGGKASTNTLIEKVVTSLFTRVMCLRAARRLTIPS